MKELGKIRQVVLVCRQVDHGIHALQGLVQSTAITHVAQHKLGRRRHIVRQLPIEVHGRRQVVENAHRVTLRQQEINGVRADEAGPACY